METENNTNNKSNQIGHHIRQQYCHTRLKYRQGKALTAVKVYTVINESIHLLIFGVPKINLHNEVKRALQKFGPLKSICCKTKSFLEENPGFEIEQFTDIYYAVFEKLEHSRRAKKFLDAKNFYGGILHISYAPEYESLDEIKQKLQKRSKEVEYRIKVNNNKEAVPKNSNSGEPSIKKLRMA